MQARDKFDLSKVASRWGEPECPEALYARQILNLKDRINAQGG
jgi:hypothetical protein